LKSQVGNIGESDEGKTMVRRFLSKKPHALYDYNENAFKCLLCAKSIYLYEPWEIVRHLKKTHKINRNRQVIPAWNKDFEKQYLSKRKKSIKYLVDEEVHIIKKSLKAKDLQMEQKRIAEERQAARDR